LAESERPTKRAGPLRFCANLTNFTTPAYPLANVLIDPVAASTSLQHGSSSQQRKGHIGLGHPLLAQPACVAQDHARAGRRADLQACEEGRHSLAVRTPARRTCNGILTKGRIGEILRDSHGIAQTKGTFCDTQPPIARANNLQSSPATRSSASSSPPVWLPAPAEAQVDSSTALEHLPRYTNLPLLVQS
jgi:hypothetical protein